MHTEILVHIFEEHSNDYLLTFGYFWWSFGGSHQAVSLKLSSWPVSGRSVDSV